MHDRPTKWKVNNVQICLLNTLHWAGMLLLNTLHWVIALLCISQRHLHMCTLTVLNNMVVSPWSRTRILWNGLRTPYLANHLKISFKNLLLDYWLALEKGWHFEGFRNWWKVQFLFSQMFPLASYMLLTLDHIFVLNGFTFELASHAFQCVP